MTTITLDDMQRDLSGYLKRVSAGETLLIIQADKPIAELKPVLTMAQQLRPFGLCAGEFIVPADFDTPLPDTILADFEGLMKLLLDTHIFLWYISGDPQLSALWLAVLRDPTNMIYLSVVSVWEASIKYHLGKLPLPAPPETYLPAQRQRHMITPLPLEENDLRLIGTLPRVTSSSF